MKTHHLVALIVIAAAAPALAADIGVTQKDQTFSKPSVTIAAGDTVMWGNADDVSHNITIRTPSGKLIDTGSQEHGKVIKHTFDTAGTYKIICSIHPKMKMDVVVQ